jgi:hypothetical protein
MIPRHLPDYVERDGAFVYPPPYVAKDARITGFVIDANREVIDDLVRRELVEPTDGELDYRCLLPSIVILYATIARLSSRGLYGPDRGYVTEKELSIWCPVYDVRSGRGVWYLPYVFVDNPQAVATGREVYGYPKQAAVVSGLVNRPEGMSVKAPAFRSLAANVPATLEWMVTVRRTKTTLPPGWSDVPALVTELAPEPLEVDPATRTGAAATPSVRLMPSGRARPSSDQPMRAPWERPLLRPAPGRDITRSPEENIALLGSMITSPTLVFLKQFRDAECPTKACYQAVVEAPIVPTFSTGSSSAALNGDDFRVKVANWPSHRMAEMVGVAAGTELTPRLAFEAKLDFEIQLGTEVWRAPT